MIECSGERILGLHRVMAGGQQKAPVCLALPDGRRRGLRSQRSVQARHDGHVITMIMC